MPNLLGVLLIHLFKSIYFWVDSMYLQQIVEIFYISLITVYIIFITTFIYITAKGKREIATDGGSKNHGGIEKSEKIWLGALFIIAVIGNIIFLSPIIPSIQYNLYTSEEPVKTIEIIIEDHEFILPENPIKLPLGEPIEFKVYSNDLTYGFGVFREDGTMVFQMQVVPGYENRIVWIFDEPGVYTIRSTEYSGPEHPYMVLYDVIVVGGD